MFLKIFLIFLIFLISFPLLSKGIPIMLQIKSEESIPVDFRDGVEEALTEMNFTLVDQKAQEEALKEQTEQREKGCYDDECLVDTGKMLAARGLIVVEVEKRDESIFRFKFRYVDFETGTTTKTKMTYFNFSLLKYKELNEFGKSITKELFSDNTKSENIQIQQKVIPPIESDKKTEEIKKPEKKEDSNQINSNNNAKEIQLSHDKLKLSIGLKAGGNMTDIMFLDEQGHETWASFDGRSIMLDFELIYNLQKYLGVYILGSLGVGSVERFETSESNTFKAVNIFLGLRGDYFVNFALSSYLKFGIGFSSASLKNDSNSDVDVIYLSGPVLELEAGITYFNSTGSPIFDLGLGITSMMFKDVSLKNSTKANTTQVYLSFRYYFMSK